MERTTDVNREVQEEQQAAGPEAANVPQKRDLSSTGKIAAWTGLFLLLALIAVAMFKAYEGTAEQGERARDFTLTTFDGEEIKLSNLRGKVVVINFWASWCNPCEDEAPDLEATWREYEPTGEVVFLGVDYSDTRPEALKYLEKFGITYPNGPDLGTRISHAYRISGVPETYIIGKDGVVAATKIGPFRDSAEIKALIDPLLAE